MRTWMLLVGIAVTCAISALRSAAAGPAPADLRFQQLALGPTHSCGITLDQDAFCWGDNRDGQLGIGNTRRQTEPVAVVGGHKFAQLVAGGMGIEDAGSHTCGRTVAGSVLCWGANQLGQLGDGTREPRKVPTPVAGKLTAKLLFAHGYEVCAIDAADRVACWGVVGQDVVSSGNYGLVLEPGDLPMPERAKPTRFVPVRDQGICAQDAAGLAYCWRMKARSELMVGVITPDGVKHPSVTLGGGIPAPCAVSDAGVLSCWNVVWMFGGARSRFKGGVSVMEPQALAPDVKFKDVAIDREGLWALAVDGRLYRGTRGKAFSKMPPPAPAAPEQRFRALVVGGHPFACALTVDGAAWCWGRNQDGETGVDDDSPHLAAPAAVAGGVRFASLVTRAFGACGLTADGRAYCWGRNGDGELGDGSRRDRRVPTAVAPPDD